MQAQVLLFLYHREAITADGLYTLLYSARPEADQPACDRVVAAHVCNLRKRLKAKELFGIETVGGETETYRMTATLKTLLKPIIERPT